MTELHLISFCYFNSPYGYYNSAFVDGYLLGLITVLLLCSLIGIVNDVTEKYKYNEDDDRDEPKNNDTPDEDSNNEENEEEEEREEEEEERVEKSEEDKKDE